MPDPFSLTIITALIVKSASSWLEALRGTLLDKAKDIAVDKGKEAFEKKGGDYLRSALHLDQKDQLKHLQAALEKAIAGGLLAFQSRVERDQYRDILKILFESGPHSDALRREAMRLFTLWDTPNFDELNEIYNRSIRFLTLSQPSPPAEVNAAPYLISFFQALIEALYADPYFKQQMKDVLQTRAGLRTAANTTSIAADTHMLVTYASSMDSVMKQMFSLFQKKSRKRYG